MEGISEPLKGIACRHEVCTATYTTPPTYTCLQCGYSWKNGVTPFMLYGITEEVEEGKGQ